MPGLNLFAANSMTPWMGYGKNEIGLAHGLLAAEVDMRLCTPEFVPLDAPVLVVGNPGWGEKFNNHRRWLYTMSESTRVSQRWIDLVNGLYERVLLPCEALVDVYRESGVRIPIHVAGHGIDHFLPKFKRRTITPSKQTPFTFLTYSRGEMRKGAELALFAFKRTFGGDKRFRMMVKAPPSPTWLDGLQDEQIEVVAGNISEDSWHGMLERAHVFVFPSRAEGFGMPPREATLAGLPTLATQWLGMADVPHWGFPLRVKELRPATYDQWEANAEGALWAEPEWDDIDRWMKWVVDYYGEACDLAESGREYLLKNNSYLGVGQKIKQLLEEEPEPEVEGLSPYSYRGVKLWVRNGEYAHFDRGIVAEVQHAYFWDELRQREIRTVLDVGAHIGAFTLYAHKLWPDAKIIAVEPEADNFRLLELNTAAILNIYNAHARIGYCPGEYVLAKARHNSGGHLVVHKGAALDERYVEAALLGRAFTIEELMELHGISRLDLLKLDCEGCEMETLENISDDALDRIQIIVGERHVSQAEFQRRVGERLQRHFASLYMESSPEPELGTFLAMKH